MTLSTLSRPAAEGVWPAAKASPHESGNSFGEAPGRRPLDAAPIAGGDSDSTASAGADPSGEAPSPAGQIRVRAARQDDAPAIAAIYNQGIEERQATFQTRLHGPEDFRGRISDTRRPMLVAEADDRLAGWAGVVGYSDSCTYYDGVGEAMLYVDRGARRAGVGSELLKRLALEAERQGFYKLVGKIFTTNRPSIELVARCGWREVGVHRRHGRLDGEWRDVLVVERLLT